MSSQGFQCFQNCIRPSGLTCWSFDHTYSWSPASEICSWLKYWVLSATWPPGSSSFHQQVGSSVWRFHYLCQGCSAASVGASSSCPPVLCPRWKSAVWACRSLTLAESTAESGAAGARRSGLASAYRSNSRCCWCAAVAVVANGCWTVYSWLRWGT